MTLEGAYVAKALPDRAQVVIVGGGIVGCSIAYHLARRGTTAAEAEILNIFSSPVMLEGSNVAVRAAVDEINNLKTVDRAAVLAVSERFSGSEFGEGVARLESANPALTNTAKKQNLIAIDQIPSKVQFNVIQPAFIVVSI